MTRTTLLTQHQTKFAFDNHKNTILTPCQRRDQRRNLLYYQVVILNVYNVYTSIVTNIIIFSIDKNGKGSKNSKRNKTKKFLQTDIADYFQDEAECSGASEDEDDYFDYYDENDSFIDDSDQVK